MSHASNNQKTVGILGGMGPYATLMFMQRILEMTPAKKDWEHIRTVTDSNTKIPSRSRAILYDEPSPVEGMVDSCQRLQNYPVDVITCPCNSAAFWMPEVRRRIKIPIIDIIETATKALFSQSDPKRVTVLGGAVTYKNATYKPHIEQYGGTYVPPTAEIQERIVQYIEGVKLMEAGNTDRQKSEFREFLDNMVRELDVQGVVLACTELTPFDDLQFAVPVVDSSKALAQHVVGYATGQEPVSFRSGEVRAFWQKRAEALAAGQLDCRQSTMLTSSEQESAARDEKEKAILLPLITPILNQDGRLLELGCGIGRWSRVLAPLCKCVDAYDYNSIFIENARRLTAEAGITNVDFSAVPVEDISLPEQYEYAVSIALLHYLNDDQFAKAISTVRASLQPGGYAIFRESFGCERRYELHGYYSDVLDTEYYAIYRTPEEIIDQLGDGFSLLVNEQVIEPSADKPETCQRVLILRKEARHRDTE